MISQKQIKEIMNEVEYEWNDEAEKELQEQLIHWALTYHEEGVIIKPNTIEVPNKIAHDFWRDLFTNVVQTVHKRVENKLEEFKEK